MNKTLFRIPVVLTLLMAFVGSPTAEAAAVTRPATDARQGTSPASLINPDGTLNLNSGFSGALSLNGWDVRLDPERGPLLTASAAPASAGERSPAAVGSWAPVGAGGGGAFNGPVYALAVMDGDIYVGGDFHDVDNVPETFNLAVWHAGAWSAVGTPEPGLSPLLGGAVYALAVDGSILYVGGSFYYVIDGSTYIHEAKRIASWDGTHWAALGNGGTDQGSLNGTVYALAVDSLHHLYAGGSFTDVKNGSETLTAADYVAMWDPEGVTWSALNDDGSDNGSIADVVLALAASGTIIYVGGRFTNVSNGNMELAGADYVAKWNGTDWSQLGWRAGGEGSLDYWVLALAVDAGGALYAGGYFQNAANPGGSVAAADYIAKWSGGAWSALGSGLSGNGCLTDAVRGIAVSGTNVYAAGDFEGVYNGGALTHAADYIAKFDTVGGLWSALGDDGAGEGALKAGSVNAVLVNGTDLIAGGAFIYVKDGSIIRSQAARIARWTATNWQAMGTIQGSVNDMVFAIAVDGDDVYVGGRFRGIANGYNTTPPVTSARYIAKWNPSTGWSALGTGVAGWALQGDVNAIAVHDGLVYAGGAFTQAWNGAVPDMTAQFVAVWNGTTWSGLGDDGTGYGPIHGVVSAMAFDGDDLYVGGSFENVTDHGTIIPEADYIARWDGVNWHALGGSGGDGSLNLRVSAIAVSHPNIFVGGIFTNVRDSGSTLSAADYIACWDGTHWSALGSGVLGDGSLNGTVQAVAVGSDGVYVGGAFTNVKNDGTTLAEADYIARWDHGNWSALGGGGPAGGSLSGEVATIAVDGPNVYVGGRFVDVNNGEDILTAADYVAKWDGSNWSALGSDSAGEGAIKAPTMGGVFALAVGLSDLYVGGYFYNINDTGKPYAHGDYIAAYGIPTYVEVSIGGTPIGTYEIPGGSARVESYADFNAGPVQVQSTKARPIVTSERFIYAEGAGSDHRSGTPTSYSEMMGFPADQLTTEYWFPWYNNVNMWSQLRFANPSATLSATVSVYLGTTLLGSYLMGPASSARVDYPGVNGGPLRIVSSGDVPIIAAERVIYSDGNGTVQNGDHTSYYELMGFPGNQLATEYWIPWYNNVNMWTQLRFANPSASLSTTVSVYLGMTLLGSYPLGPASSARIDFPDTNGGPLRIVSSGGVNIIAAERVIYSEGGVHTGTHTSYSELMAIPGNQLTSTYWFPWYGYPDVGTWSQLRVANPSDTESTTVNVYLGTTLLGMYGLTPSLSLRLDYVGRDSGPLKVVSTGLPIIAAMRVIQSVSGTQTSYSEITGYPDDQLTTAYLFPWYNNFNFDTQLRMAVP